ncbi:MAG: DEAD/DEAH box helicase family protein [Chloracidobacterium sp.]|nr:DEAD/DEAH box helicase family protein [Chloracidobacterium sp.]
MMATVRNRRGIISAVTPINDLNGESVHLVQIDYTDTDSPVTDSLIWEREIQPNLLEARALPDLTLSSPMGPADFEAIQRSVRWSALTPFDRFSDLNDLVTAPYFGAVQTDDYQLLPVLTALRMPRIGIMIADDVGLGKTIEAGFIITELLRRRRINRVMILCGASLRLQWQDEMHSKFSSTFEVIDKAATHELQRNLGVDANPWRTFPRVISSYHYLKQPDILEQFLATCRQANSTVSANLPWDLLIVDEAHNLAPSNFGADSDRKTSSHTNWSTRSNHHAISLIFWLN